MNHARRGPGETSRAVAADAWLTPRALSVVLLLAAAASVGVAVGVLAGFDGWSYYRAPLATRGYLPQHPVLRPSGLVGLPLGIAGVGAMACTLPYLIRKRWKALDRLGSLRGWLEAHIFFGIVGPVLITFHTSFKFNGLISIAYWLMALVWSSGFVGRYLYVRIPKTIRGAELTRKDVEVRLDELAMRLGEVPPALAVELAHLQQTLEPAAGRAPGVLDLFFGELRVRVRLAIVRRHLYARSVDVAALRQMVALMSERASLLRRLAHLERARRLFAWWHVFHRPLVVGMFAIVAVHVAVALFFGYAGGAD